jgi:hypothetical protein
MVPNFAKFGMLETNQEEWIIFGWIIFGEMIYGVG